MAVTIILFLISSAKLLIASQTKQAADSLATIPALILVSDKCFKWVLNNEEKSLKAENRGTDTRLIFEA